MSDPMTAVLGGIVIAFTSGGIGAYIGGRLKVDSSICEERRSSCQDLLLEKIDVIDAKVDKIIKALSSNNIMII